MGADPAVTYQKEGSFLPRDIHEVSYYFVVPKEAF